MASWVLRMACAVGLVALGASVSRADGPAARSVVPSSAERELVDVLLDAGLSGSAPMVGEARFVSSADRAEAAVAVEAERDFEAVLDELGLSGSAPLVGMARAREEQSDVPCQACAHRCVKAKASGDVVNVSFTRR